MFRKSCLFIFLYW